MTNTVVPKLSKWPFVIGDVVLVGFAALVVFRTPGPLDVSHLVASLAAVLGGGWLCALPFLREYQAAVKLGEASTLADAATRMNHLEKIRTEIAGATAQWQTVQQQSNQTAEAAKQIAGHIKAQLDDFCAFLAKARDLEKDHLKLEVEKLRRAERDWLQAAVLVLDHVFALHAAAIRTGQPGVVAQLSQFQFACRDALRRVGLAGFAPADGEAVDPQLHQLEDGSAPPDPGMRITEVLAMGYTYQGELVRRALVKAASAVAPPDSLVESGAPASAAPSECGNPGC